jgi:formate hydrogenlyase subunit 3/multisubunit Na+/H+ antiporter MnhD subunit
VTLTIALLGTAALLGLAATAVIFARSEAATRIVYTACLGIAAISLAAAAFQLLSAASPLRLTLPLGVPWLGAHFRLDALSAFFLLVVDLGALSASLFALGYGEHETAPQRVLPFYPAFLAGMTLVILADDAFTFLASWEFMSLTSWALVMAHHRVADNVRAGYVYLVMARKLAALAE